jgi:hypothetical protein
LGEFSPLGDCLRTLGNLLNYKSSPHFCATFSLKIVIELKLTKHGLGYNLVDFFTNLSGVDVMITIFCGFSQFLAKKFAFFSKANVMIIFFRKLVVVKYANFSPKFSTKIFKKS